MSAPTVSTGTIGKATIGKGTWALFALVVAVVVAVFVASAAVGPVRAHGHRRVHPHAAAVGRRHDPADVGAGRLGSHDQR